MNIAYRCEHCGTMLGTADLQDKPVGDSSWRARCPGCGKGVSVPRLLAQLPTPQIAEHAATLPVRSVADAWGSSSGASVRVAHPCEVDSGNAALAKAMPWAMSLFLHLGVAMILLFIGALVMAKHSEAQIENKGLDAATMARFEDGNRRPIQEGVVNGESWVGRLKSEGSKEPVRPNSLAEIIGDGRPRGSLLKDGLDGGPSRRGIPGGSLIPGGTGDPFKPIVDPRGIAAAHIVYVIDRSGSMVDNFDALREALGTGISNLKPEQDFHIIMFAGGVPQEMSSRKLVEASVVNIQQAERFLQGVQASGDTDPLPALKRAFEVLAAAPEGTKLIQLLTDGEFPDNQKVVDLIAKMNAGPQVHVNTYLYGARSKAAQSVLEEIAGKNKGQYKYYSSM